MAEEYLGSCEESDASTMSLPSSDDCCLDSKLRRTPLLKDRWRGRLKSCEDEDWVLWTGLNKKCPVVVFHSCAIFHQPLLPIGAKFHLTFKIIQGESKLISTLLHAHGFKEVHPNASEYNIVWTGIHPKPHHLQDMMNHQRINHFPRSYELTRKDRLYKNIERMQHSKGLKHFNFVPQTFVIPAEYANFCSAHNRCRGPWIVKPVASSQGRGIYIINRPDQVPVEEQVVVAKYITNPLLVNGHKCDIRLYVAVTSYDPLVIYLYEEGLVRIATVKYDDSAKNLWNPCMHLCNYSINKYHSDYIKCSDPESEDMGNKWTFTALLRHLDKLRMDTTCLLEATKDLIIKAIISASRPIITACKMFVPHKKNCFELYGFDILVDANMRPWLLEVNLSPSLGCDTPLDVKVKSGMIADLLTLVGVPAVDPVLRRVEAIERSPSRQRHNRKTRRALSLDKMSNSSTSVPVTSEDIRVANAVREELERRGSYILIFPSPDAWPRYKDFLEHSADRNLLLQELLFGMTPPQAPNSTGPAGDKMGGGSGLMSNGMASDPSLVGGMTSAQDSVEEQQQGSIWFPLVNDGVPSGKARLAPLVVKGCTKERDITYNIFGREPKDFDRQRQHLKESIVQCIRRGCKLNNYQLRKCFGQYLHYILLRMRTFESEDTQRLNLIARFVQRACVTLREPSLAKPLLGRGFGGRSALVSSKDKAAIVAKQLHDFLHVYGKETEELATARDRPQDISSHLFKDFIAVASEEDIQEVLDYQKMKSKTSLNYLDKSQGPTTIPHLVKKKVVGSSMDKSLTVPRSPRKFNRHTTMFGSSNSLSNQFGEDCDPWEAWNMLVMFDSPSTKRGSKGIGWGGPKVDVAAAAKGMVGASGAAGTSAESATG